MKYKVRSIDGHYVTVDFENGTWATALVDESAEPGAIDKTFGQYSQEYGLAKPATTKISIGEERETSDPYPKVEKAAEPSTASDPFRFEYGAGMEYADPLVMILMASYLSDKGQTALKDCLDAKIKAILDNPEFSVDTFIKKLNDTL